MVRGIPYIRYFLYDTAYPAFSARPRVTMFADAPIGVAFPPRQVPSARDHHTGIMAGCWIIDFKSDPGGKTKIACAISVTRGIILAIKIVFSTTVEAMAENHRIIIAVANMFSAFGFVNETMTWEMSEIKPTLTTPDTTIKRPIK